MWRQDKGYFVADGFKKTANQGETEMENFGKQLKTMLCAMMVMGVLGLMSMTGCQKPEGNNGQTTENVNTPSEFGGGVSGFKVPIPTGYDWEVSQSWGSHCEICDQRYGDWDYCNQSHTFSCCEHSWDFNLPGYSDLGKPVLASGDGHVEKLGYSESWGNHVVINHGSDVCSRYAHMVDGSIDHLEEGQYVCQGLKLGEIGESGNADGSHLHFQFESCESGETLEMGFTDGNDVPICTRGEDIYNSAGHYSFLHLSNQMREDCSSDDEVFGGGNLPSGGWTAAQCGSLPGCPLIPNCGRISGHSFGDSASMSGAVRAATSYLWSECALDGYGDGSFHPSEKITRAQALKIPMFLYGLMEDCGATEPFADVNREDWYFSVVACAVRHGVISTVISYFLPNQEVTFGEAAKFVVETARRAGVIEVSEPSGRHFRNIASPEWAYFYVETLYSYGGVTESMMDYASTRSISREEYAIMVASMSPCFCQNVNCETPCSCDQATFACVDEGNPSSDSGGGSSSDESSGDDGESDSESDGDSSSGSSADEPSDGGEDRRDEFDLEIDCNIDSDNTECGSEEVVLHIRCGLSNDGTDEVRVNNLILHLEDEENCMVTDGLLQGGVGTQNVDPGETRDLSGHFEVSCEEAPDDEEFELVFDLVERIAGLNTTYEELLFTTLVVDGEEFEVCEEAGGSGSSGSGGSSGSSGSGGSSGSSGGGSGGGSSGSSGSGSASLDWCDPLEGYTLAVDSLGGRFDYLLTGRSYASGAGLPPSGHLSLHLSCSDLPATVLITPGSEGMIVWVEEDATGGSSPMPGMELPDFAVWEDYAGALTLNPASSPDTITSFFASTEEDSLVLVRIPPE